MPKRKLHPPFHAKRDITGQKFNHLTAIRLVDIYTFPNKKSGSRWLFKCDCGGEVLLFRRNVLSQATKSCGCLTGKLIGDAHKTHDDSKTNFYQVWDSLKNRCSNPNNPGYKNYGGRGIRCFWDKYEGFKRDMMPTYRPGLQIERKDNDGHYCKENCRWATRTEQQANRRITRFLELDGLRMPLTWWARKYNFQRVQTLRDRIDKGWPTREALTTRSRKDKRSQCRYECQMPAI
jgi:hypothetical protein